MNRILDTPLGPVECARTGEGPAVLLLHGAMGGYDQGLLLGRTVLGTPGYQFVALSRPGYLGTPLSSGPAPEQQADLCAAALGALAVHHASVIAISGGGQCALQFALRHPDRCTAIVMISACSARIPGRPPLRFHLLKLAAHFPPLMNVMRRKAAANPEAAARRSITDPELRARTLADPESGPLLRELQLGITDRMAARLPGTQNDIAQSRSPFHYPVERITAPTLVVHGTDDEAAPFAHAESLAARIPNAELLAIKGGRHVSIFTHRGLIHPRVRSFMG
jgi:pimeloyl-ACP methyl ester carboxylesterase